MAKQTVEGKKRRAGVLVMFLQGGERTRRGGENKAKQKGLERTESGTHGNLARPLPLLNDFTP